MAKSNIRNRKLESVDDLFGTEESRADNRRERVMDIPLSEISDFPSHPFRVLQDDAMLGRLIPQGAATYLVISKYGRLLGIIDRLFNTWGEIIENLKPAQNGKVTSSEPTLNESFCEVEKVDDDTIGTFSNYEEDDTQDKANDNDVIDPVANISLIDTTLVLDDTETNTPVVLIPNDDGTCNVFSKSEDLLGRLIPQFDRTYLVLSNEGKMLGFVDRFYSPWELLLTKVKQPNISLESVSVRQASDSRKQDKGESYMRKTVLNVEGMSCDHCVKTITKAVGVLSGVDCVAVDLAAKTVAVTYDPDKSPLEKIKIVIEDQGYEVAA